MLTWEFPPRIIGGISTHVYNLSSALVGRGVPTHVITCDFPKAPPREVIDGVCVSRVDSGQVPQSNFLLWVYHLNSEMIKRADEILREERFDVIHAHDWLVGRAAVHLKTRYNLSLVTTIHATEIGRGGLVDSEYRKKVHVVERRLAEASERVICCSDYMVNHLQNTLGVPTDRIHVIHNGVDASRFRDGKPSEEIRLNGHRDAGKTVLFVGRLVKEKGVSTLLEAFEDMSSNGTDARLVIAGDGPMRESLAGEAVRLGLDGNVEFKGFVDDATLVSLYKTSDVLVVPSLYEPFGMVALEGMAAGTPVVVSDVGGLSEVVEDGVTGLKVPPGDHKPLSNAIARMLRDQGLAAKLKENAHRLAKRKFAWDQVADSTIPVYGLALSETRVQANPIADEDLLSEQDLLHFLLGVGATGEENAKTAREIASAVGAPEVPVKLILGRQVSGGYVSTMLSPDITDVRYYLSQTGIIKTCSDLS